MRGGLDASRYPGLGVSPHSLHLTRNDSEECRLRDISVSDVYSLHLAPVGDCSPSLIRILFPKLEQVTESEGVVRECDHATCLCEEFSVLSRAPFADSITPPPL